MAQSYYYTEVRNTYLGRYQRVTGRTRGEAELKASLLQQRWQEQEGRARYRQAVADLKAEALAMTEDAQAAIEDHRSILQATLDVDDRVPWESLLVERPFDEPQPALEEIMVRLRVPAAKPILEALRLTSAARRIEGEQDAQSLFEDETQGYRIRNEHYLERQAAELDELRALRDCYEREESEAIEKYIALVLSRSQYPETFSGEVATAYLETEKLAVVNAEIPRIEHVPSYARYRFDAERDTIVGIELSVGQRSDLYDELVYQTVLRTIHEIFEGDYIGAVTQVCVNAFTTTTNVATGRDERVCIASCLAPRQTFEQFDLARVKSRECFKALNGLVGRRPSSAVAVQPYRSGQFGTGDAVGIDLGDRGDIADDLLTMDPFAFEQLVGALFRRLYEDEQATVEVTQQSGDGGIDVVVTDPHPIKGGKTIIQVKRYGGVIGVGYVRELYGTMMAERAAKGILVGTGHYGADAQSFVADKPITLINGDTLLELLRNHGWHYRLGDLAPAPVPHAVYATESVDGSSA
jgi:restriction system protein